MGVKLSSMRRVGAQARYLTLPGSSELNLHGHGRRDPLAIRWTCVISCELQAEFEVGSVTYIQGRVVKPVRALFGRQRGAFDASSIASAGHRELKSD